jgi:hypothetical protein
MATNLLPLEKLIAGLQSFDAAQEVETIVHANGQRLVELQQEQLSFGVDITGRKRADEYRPLTKYLKGKFGNGIGRVTDRVTFFMTGNLYGSLKPVFSGDKYEVKSSLFTYDKMKARIGDENYGLSPDQREEFALTVTIPEFKKVLELKTGLKI